MRGILLAGGTGSRMYPLTRAVSKHLLPVYDTPLIYFPLSQLMLAGVREILLIATPADVQPYRDLLGDGSHLGLSLTYATQPRPAGVCEALIIGHPHVQGDEVALALGDNVLFGRALPAMLRREAAAVGGCTLFGYSVSDPERYGVAEVDPDGRLISLEEKPARPRSHLAVIGLYFFAPDVVELAPRVGMSVRGELELTDVNRMYLSQGRARLVRLGRGTVWLDAGSCETLLQASQVVRTVTRRQGRRIACLEEVAMRMGYITAAEGQRLGEALGSSPYGAYVREVARSVAELKGRPLPAEEGG